MPIPQLNLASFGNTNFSDLLNGTSNYLKNSLPLAKGWSGWTWPTGYGRPLLEWLQQPHVLALIMAWWITFTIVLTLLLCLGFGPVGIVPGSIAAAFQSWAYAGFTPAGGIFATLTSMAMLGYSVPFHTMVSAGLATAVTYVVWACGAGR